MPIDYLRLIAEHVKDIDGRMVPAWMIHSTLVTRKALEIAQDYVERTGAAVDMHLLEEIGMLHDIGIFETNVPYAELNGKDPYVMHIIHGERILRKAGFEEHASAARNHINIPAHEVRENQLPLPEEDFVPSSVEEEILCLADYSYRKIFKVLFKEQTDEQIRTHLSQFSEDAVARYVRLRDKYLP